MSSATAQPRQCTWSARDTRHRHQQTTTRASLIISWRHRAATFRHTPPCARPGQARPAKERTCVAHGLGARQLGRSFLEGEHARELQPRGLADRRGQADAVFCTGLLANTARRRGEMVWWVVRTARQAHARPRFVNEASWRQAQINRQPVSRCIHCQWQAHANQPKPRAGAERPRVPLPRREGSQR